VTRNDNNMKFIYDFKTGKIKDVKTLEPRVTPLSGKVGGEELLFKVNELIESHNKLLDVLDVEVTSGTQTKKYIRPTTGGDD